jgi:hypothetical protein
MRHAVAAIPVRRACRRYVESTRHPGTMPNARPSQQRPYAFFRFDARQTASVVTRNKIDDITSDM